MPIYKWRDKKTKKTVEVIRKFDAYEQPPEAEEKSELTMDEFLEADWERIIGTDIHVTKGHGWGPGKGYWIHLLTVIGISYVQNTWI